MLDFKLLYQFFKSISRTAAAQGCEVLAIWAADEGNVAMEKEFEIQFLKKLKYKKLVSQRNTKKSTKEHKKILGIIKNKKKKSE